MHIIWESLIIVNTEEYAPNFQRYKFPDKIFLKFKMAECQFLYII